MKVKAVVIGYGNRGAIYANYAFKYPSELEIVAVVDTDEYRLSLAKQKFNLEPSQCITTFEEFVGMEKFADCAIVATMDELHYDMAKAVIDKGYNMLIEKPVVNNSEQLEELKVLAEKKGIVMMVGHVLRYTPFYSQIKAEILNGTVGEVVHIETSELVGIAHTSSSYIRGRWKSEATCGSGMLLAKCCHDLDLLCWLNNATTPEEIASYGGRNFILPNKAPKGSVDRCYNGCPHIDSCKYSAKSLYVKNDWFGMHTYEDLKSRGVELTEENKIQALKTCEPVGECAYKTNSDLVDHQCLILKFANGSTAMHSMISSVPRPGRKIHIIGTDGEIEGFFESNKFHIRKFDFETGYYKETTVDVSQNVEQGVDHGGGDICLMRDFVKRMRGEKPSISATDISDSINGHECVYSAEKSRKEGGSKKIKYSK